MPANVDGMVREGISAYRSGRKDEAQALLLRAVEIDQFNEQAWLWLSAVVETPEEQRTCLENVLTINPTNERARQGLETIEQRYGSGPKNTQAQADDILANTSFALPVAGQEQSGSSSSGEDELPTSIEWDAPPTATSSSSSNYKVNEPSPTEYDDWVSKLNIGGTTPDINPATLDAAAKFMSISDDDEDEDNQRFNPASVDDLFSSGPFSNETAISPISQPQDSLKPQSPLRPANPVSGVPATTKVNKSPLSPTMNVFSDEGGVQSGTFLEDFDDAEMEKLEANEFFQYIPREISATRLPGTSERYPVLIMAGLIILILLNIGALMLFIQNMTAKAG